MAKVPAREKIKARDLSYWYPFNVDQWYTHVRDHTFRSEFIHLSVEEAQQLIVVLEENALKIDPTPYDDKQEQAHPVLPIVAAKIDAELEKFQGHHAFVRLSSRSPKDAVLGDVIDDHLDVEVRNYLKAGGQATIPKMHPLVYVASAKALEIKSGREALQLLLNSFRVLEDLNYYIANPTVFPVCITLREWIDIPPSMEFRGFVCNDQFTAMSQYFHESYFEDLVKSKKAVKQQIIDFWEKFVKDKLHYLSSYVVDFAVVGDKVWILELNPFDEYTGTGLFSWEGHNQRLKQGPFKFAILKAPLTHGNIWINVKLRKSLARVLVESEFANLNLNSTSEK